MKQAIHQRTGGDVAVSWRRPNLRVMDRQLVITALLACASVLSGTLAIPAVRPFMAWAAPGNESAAHAFMAVNMLGGAVAAPLLARVANRLASPAAWVAALATLDGLFLALLTAGPPLWLLIAIRTLQGAASISALSLLLGTAASGEPARRGARYGLLGTAMMIGVAAGAPLGTLCLRLGISAPLLAGALLEFAVALSVGFAGLEAAKPRARMRARVPWLAMSWVFAERFAVGLFVVTFAFHARECVRLDDSAVGVALSAFMVPFALAVYPSGKLADRIGSTGLAAVCLALYGLGFLLLPSAGRSGLLPCMLLLGLSSAAAFAASMREASASLDAEARVVAMSALNSIGGLGMLLGTAIAGVVSALFRARGDALHHAHETAFWLGGVTSLVIASATFVFVWSARRTRVQSGARWQRS